VSLEQRGWARKTERLLLVLGVGLIAIYGAARLYQVMASRSALRQFESDRLASQRPEAAPGEGKVDLRLWSPKRVAAYREALALDFDPPLAVLSIAKLGLRIPVFEGTDELTLNRGGGRIAGTAKPGGPGNVGIAAHRDGFFRTLKDIQLGDRIELSTATKDLTYLVDEIEIVAPEDVRVLQPRARPSLTLVTCFPFYFVGDAPQRYIVHASVSDSSTPEPGNKPFSSAVRKITNKENRK